MRIAFRGATSVGDGRTGFPSARCGGYGSRTANVKAAMLMNRLTNKTTIKKMKININDNSVSSSAQKQMILDYMLEGNPITPLEALEKFHCFRLGARIWELVHKDGYLIYKEMVKDPKTGKRYARYSL